MKAFKWFDKHLEETLLCIALIGMACIMMIQVLFRFMLSSSLSWSEEFTRYLFVWSTFLSISFCAKEGLAIAIDMVVNAVPKRAQRYFHIAVDALSMIVFLYLISPSYTYLIRTMENGQTSPAMEIPMEWIYAAPLVGFLLAAVRCAQDIYRQVKSDKTASKAQNNN